MRRLASAARAAQISACAAGALAVLSVAAGVRGIVSESMPRGLYTSQPFAGVLERGDTVELCLPRRVSQLARARGYLAPGILCDDGTQRIVKAVLAVTGDTVDLSQAGFRLQGRLLPNTAPRRLDSLGRPLPHVRPGRYPVPSGMLWIVSTEIPESFDSRYFGPVPLSAIRRRFHPLWTESHRTAPVRLDAD